MQYLAIGVISLAALAQPASAQVLPSDQARFSEGGLPQTGIWGTNDSALVDQDALSPATILELVQEALASDKVYSYDAGSLEGYDGTAYLVLPGFVGSCGFGPHGKTHPFQVPKLHGYEQVWQSLGAAREQIVTAMDRLSAETDETIVTSHDPRIKPLRDAFYQLAWGAGPTAAVAIHFRDLPQDSSAIFSPVDGGQFPGTQRGEGIALSPDSDGWVAFLFELDFTPGRARVQIDTAQREGLVLTLWHGDTEEDFAALALDGSRQTPSFQGLDPELLARHGIDPDSVLPEAEENPHLSEEQEEDLQRARQRQTEAEASPLRPLSE